MTVPCQAGILMRRVVGSRVTSVATIVRLTQPNTLIVMCARSNAT